MASKVRVVFSRYIFSLYSENHPHFGGHFDVISFGIRYRDVLTKLFPVQFCV
jgi:hypothetical protein